MDKIVITVILIAMLALVIMTGAQTFLSSFDSTMSESVGRYDRDENTIRTDISPVSTALLPGRQILEVTLRNDGETSLADFARWDVTVQYYDYLNNYLVSALEYVEGTPGDNQWTVKGIYLEAGAETAELLEPGVFNTGEEIIIRGKLSPKAHHSNYGLVVISTPNGLKTWNYFQFSPLYLHNNPTPPVADTSAQADLELSYTVPTATVLYNYDTDHDAEPGRLIEPSVLGVNEVYLARYQNWRVLFSATIFDTLEFDAVKGKTPDIIHVSGDIYAIAYQDADGDGFLKTVEISSAGAITDSVLDSLEFDTVRGEAPRIINIVGDIYAIAYRGDDGDGFLKTVEISAAGAITDSVIDSLEFDTSRGLTPDIIHVSGDIYAIAYRGDDGDGFLKTVEISTAGAITDSVVDSLEFDTVRGEAPRIINIVGDIYAIAYRGAGGDGFLKTVEISAAGVITDSVVDSLEFDTTRGEAPDIIHVSGDIYAIAYRGDDGDGFLKTVEISTAGAITDSVVDSLEFDTSRGVTPDIIHVSGNIYAVAYQGSGDDGFLKTVEISTAGAITDSVVDSLEFDTVQGLTPDIIHVSGNIYAVAYQGSGNDGFLKTVNILSDGTFGSETVINGDVNLVLWSAIKDFAPSRRGVVTAYLRDFDGTSYTEIASVTLDSGDWQGGSGSWVEAPFTFSGVSYTLPAGHYLELKIVVGIQSGDDMWFAYDTTDYNSYLELP